MIFALAFVGGYLFTESWATEPPPTNEMEQLLKKIQQNTKVVGQATQAAHEVSEKMIEEKVEEKAELVEKVVVAEKMVEKMEEKIEVYAVKNTICLGLEMFRKSLDFAEVGDMLEFLSVGLKKMRYHEDLF